MTILSSKTHQIIQSTIRKQSLSAVASQKSKSADMSRRLVHHSSLAVIPPPAMEDVWEQLNGLRHKLKDKGYYRWPPHINLLYPFIDFSTIDALESVTALAQSLESIQPFEIELSEFDCFGGKDRGVLWLKPSVIGASEESPLQQIYNTCINTIPEYTEIARPARPFAPHMTVTHTTSKNEAQVQASIQQESWESVKFPVNYIYILSRDVNAENGGQYTLSWTIPLGGRDPIYEGGRRLDLMPVHEEEWVREAKNKTYNRKKGRGKMR
mmetsp:Transcript_24883/g.36701  ORF Transcript_24883/g.36701 Transcript_24883/m.36701 type:complete len:268 (+) Transcript_24883:2-805(+)